MQEKSWVLRGVDAETRQRIEAEAQSRGVPVADYLTDVLLQRALVEHFAAAAAEPAPAIETQPRAAAQPTENFAFRHRVEALERRVSLAVGGLDSAVHALDSSVFGLAARLDETEALASETADGVSHAFETLGGELAALRKRAGDTDEGLGALYEAHETAKAETAGKLSEVEQKLDVVDAVARSADRATAQLADAYERLKHAVADDFSAFAIETAGRLNQQLEDVRAAADTAAEQADAAVAHLVQELRAVRAALEDRLDESAADTRARMQEAFEEADERFDALAARLKDNERLVVRTGEQLRAEMADVEDSAQTALEETAETLRQAGAALAAEFARATQDNHAALESVHADLSREMEDLRERHNGAVARLKAVDGTAMTALQETASLRLAMETRLSQSENGLKSQLDQAQTAWRDHLAALTARIANHERDSSDAEHALRAEGERIEACTLAALEKLARDRAEGDAALEAKIEANSTDARELQSGVMARLKLVESALGAQDISGAVSTALGPVNAKLAQLEDNAATQREENERLLQQLEMSMLTRESDLADRITQVERDLALRPVDRDFDQRLGKLEAAAGNVQTEEGLTELRAQVATLSVQVESQRLDAGLMQQVEEFGSRLAATQSQATDASDQVQGLARMLGRLAAQQAEAVTLTGERIQRLEARAGELGEAAPSNALDALQQRMAEMETRQTQGLDRLRAEISRFITDNEARFEAIENGLSAQQAVGEHANAFEEMRRRIEERVLGVEQRSIRALEQVADTMAVLEQRFSQSEEERAARSA
ncbi:MAG: hypothetical protein JNJ63_11620 [Hyphomonadaceae bacterium]|nr:hypothetical protein [Hyphomonadaceae bacterium]